MEIIEFGNLSFAYPDCEHYSLKHINLKIGTSDFVVLCGRSGCGKSTFLRQMKKELVPHGRAEGKVYYNGTCIYELDDRISASEIGFVQQNTDNQIVTDKVWHELAFGLESLGYDTKIIRRRVAEMANFFGIQTWFRKSIFELSGGQKQLLNLASIMAMQPKLLILDEPTAQLDPIAAKDFLETIYKINRELGVTVILSEHRLEEVFPMADKVIVMERGEVIAYDTVDEVGRTLSGSGSKHPMFLGLPAPMKVYAQVRPEGKCPVTVRDGRLWLSKLFEGKELPVRKLPVAASNTGDKKKQDFAVKLSDVWFKYSKEADNVVRDLSLNVGTGKLTCILGGNGAGKSTVLKIIGGMVKPYRGKVFVGGKEVGKYSQNELFVKNLGILPQNPKAIFSESTVEEDLYEMLYYDKGNDNYKRSRMESMMRLMQLEHLRKNHPYDLSGGEQQRLALGKVLLSEPKILLLDEPTKGLDPFFKQTLAGILSNLKKSGVTILMVTHDMEFCAEYADICGMFFDGGIVSMDEPVKFFSENNFYTTTANRMSRHLFQDAITYKDVVRLCEDNLNSMNI